MRLPILALFALLGLPGFVLGQSSRDTARKAVETRAAGKRGAEALAVYSKYSPPGEFVRSSTAWATEFDFSGLSVWNTANLDGTGGNRGYGTLIAKRVVVLAHHFHPGPGSSLVFLGRDQQLVWRKLVDTARVGQTDICLGLLDREVPDTVAIYPLLSLAYLADLPPYVAQLPADARLVPLIALNQKREALVHEWIEAAENVVHRPAQAPPLAPLAAPVIIGDSGAPIFLPLGRQLVLLGCNHTSNTAPFLTWKMNDLEAIMARWQAGKPRKVPWAAGR
ncbi:MAG: hypothetical protein JSR82_00815 [Verrucomicrobia bacterium]|nr:hypothetical protein [Verrucomicrobiota bacterium]